MYNITYKEHRFYMHLIVLTEDTREEGQFASWRCKLRVSFGICGVYSHVRSGVRDSFKSLGLEIEQVLLLRRLGYPGKV